jgi:polyferredoxin
MEPEMRIMGRFRKYVQLGVFLVTLGIGLQFFVYVHQASQPGPITVSRPPGVEGFLPIGALMAWKAFLVSGNWDPVHPAAMVILGFAALISLLLRKSFCGWFCPVGTLSEWLLKVGARVFGKNYQIPRWLDYPLRSLKYLLLGFFLWVVFTMPGAAIVGFLEEPYYRMADVKMLFFFTRMSLTAGIVLGILILTSLLIRNPWCRYLCPYGALMGIFALFSPTRIERNTGTCIDCRRCSDQCPYHLPVHAKSSIRSPECNGCMACTQVCPVKDTLQLKTSMSKKHVWAPIHLGMVIVVVFMVMVYTARITGHWKSSVTDHEFQVRLLVVDSPAYTHPRVE